jgi:hypothetical protein
MKWQCDRFLMHEVAVRQVFPYQYCLISAQYSSLFYEFYNSGQADEAWKPSETEQFFGYRRALLRKFLHVASVFIGCFTAQIVVQR